MESVRVCSRPAACTPGGGQAEFTCVWWQGGGAGGRYMESLLQRALSGLMPLPPHHTASCDRKWCSLCPGHRSCWEVSVIAFLR